MTGRCRTRAVLAVGLLAALSGCATLREIAALRQVEFSLDRVSSLTLAGVDLDRVRRYEDLGLVEAARIASALASRELPLAFTLHVRADNPDGNARARLMALDWTLFLQDRETVSGGLPGSVVIPTGGTADVPLAIRLDLLEFFEGSGRDLVNLALTLAGEEAPPTSVRLRAVPTVETALGPIRYPQPITIVSREFGG
jgi:hypothetical protein